MSKDDSQLLLVHGEEDDLVLFDQSVRMAETCRRAGLPVQLIPVAHSGHDIEQVGVAPISPSVERIHQETIDFFRGYLIPATVQTKP